jgi:hypothetical protein
MLRPTIKAPFIIEIAEKIRVRNTEAWPNNLPAPALIHFLPAALDGIQSAMRKHDPAPT